MLDLPRRGWQVVGRSCSGAERPPSLLPAGAAYARDVLTLLLNLALVVAFAFLARALLNARQVSWVRLLVASFIGGGVGLVVAVLIFEGPSFALDPAEPLPSTEALEIFGTAALLQIPLTMSIVVGFQLVSSRPRRKRRLRPLNPIAAIGRRFSIAKRGVQVATVSSRHGLGAVAGRARNADDLGQLARQMREAIEDLGGVYVKLGQLLATRPDLLPEEAIEELGRLHSSATPLTKDQVDGVLAAELADPDAVFSSFDADPLGSASIAQAHAATLTDGTEVVVKVQRPGLGADVERDLAILDWVSRNAERRSELARTYGARQLTEDFAEALRDELDFHHEARHVEGMAASVADYPDIVVPRVFEDYTTERVLVMERLRGRPLADLAPGTSVERGYDLADALLQSQIRAMLRGDRFHGDPHPGNVLLLQDGRLGLIDFGMTGKLDAYGRTFVLELLAALRLEDPALMYEALITGGSVAPSADRDLVERALAAFMASYSGPDMLSAEAVSDLLSLTAQLGIAFPGDAAVMFRAMATLLGTLETLSPGFPLVDRVVAAAGGELQERAMPTSLAEFVEREGASLAPVARRLPRHLDLIATQLGRGQLSTRVSLFANPQDVGVLERLLNKVLLAVISLGVLGAAVLLMNTEAGPQIETSGFYLSELFGWLGLFAGTVLVLRVLLDALRPSVSAPPR
jgi:ubiquinone biosynthesis protein